MENITETRLYYGSLCLKIGFVRTTFSENPPCRILRKKCVNILLSSRLLSRNVKIRIYKPIIFPVVLYWCETRSLTLREEEGIKENIWTEER
jgi:hypothetical protein